MQVAEKLGLLRWQLDTPLIMKAAYTGQQHTSAAVASDAAAAGSAAASKGISKQRQKAAAAPAAAAAPKLVVLLRDPAQRLLSSFLEYGHYTSRCVIKHDAA
jgi:hypothetical protein